MKKSKWIPTDFEIKVIEQRNGDKKYIPQVIIKKYNWWRDNFEVRKYILDYLEDFELSKNRFMSYDTEEKALKSIKRYKSYLKEKYGEEIVNIEYKKVNL